MVRPMLPLTSIVGSARFLRGSTGLIHIAPIFQTSGAGEYLLVLPGTGRVLVRNGNEITVQPDAGASGNLNAILTGPILAVLWHQRGLLPLHASVVVIDGRAVALCGPAASWQVDAGSGFS